MKAFTGEHIFIDTFMTSELPKYLCFIFLTKFLFWFFLMILWNTFFFEARSKEFYKWRCWLFEAICPFFLIKPKQKNKQNFVKKEFRKSWIFGGSDAMNFKLLQFSPKQQNIVRVLQSIDTFWMAIYHIGMCFQSFFSEKVKEK